MYNFPLLLDAEEALEHYHKPGTRSDAERAYIIAIMSNNGYTNTQISDSLNIQKGYTVTHLKRVGLALSEIELSLWHTNPNKITLGHVRAIANLPKTKREKLLRDGLYKRKSVRQFEALAKGENVEKDPDVKRYAEIMTEVLGRGVKVKYNSTNKTGSITLDFYKLEDLLDIASSLGFALPENY